MTQLEIVRRSRTLTQQHVADILGVNQATYCRYEKRQIAVPPHLQVRLAALFGVAREELFPSDGAQ
jgi:transcriptional regulator with XRE-family HTH domain